MTAHSKYFAPSALSRRIACPGSALLEADLPDNRPDETRRAAREGSAMHYVCEQCRRTGGKPQNWEGKTVPVEEEEGVIDIKVTQDMVKYCEKALDMMEEITAGHTVETEMRVELPGLPDMFGTIDVLVNEPPRLIVCDYKFGFGRVEAEANPQLMAYALMAAKNRPQDYEDISLVIIQPTVRHRPKVWKVQPQELADWRDKALMPAVKAIQNGKAEYHPDEKICKWCKGKEVCPALAGAGK